MATILVLLAPLAYANNSNLPAVRDSRVRTNNYEFSEKDLPKSVGSNPEFVARVQQFWTSGGRPMRSGMAALSGRGYDFDRWAAFHPDAVGNGGVFSVIRIKGDGTFIEGGFEVRKLFPSSEKNLSKLTEVTGVSWSSVDDEETDVNFTRTYVNPDGDVVTVSERYRLIFDGQKVVAKSLKSRKMEIMTEAQHKSRDGFKIKTHLFTALSRGDTKSNAAFIGALTKRLEGLKGSAAGGERSDIRKISGVISQFNKQTNQFENYQLDDSDVRWALSGEILDFVISRDYRFLQIQTEDGWTTLKILFKPSDSEEHDGVAKFSVVSSPNRSRCQRLLGLQTH